MDQRNFNDARFQWKPLNVKRQFFVEDTNDQEYNLKLEAGAFEVYNDNQKSIQDEMANTARLKLTEKYSRPIKTIEETYNKSSELTAAEASLSDYYDFERFRYDQNTSTSTNNRHSYVESVKDTSYNETPVQYINVSNNIQNVEPSINLQGYSSFKQNYTIQKHDTKVTKSNRVSKIVEKKRQTKRTTKPKKPKKGTIGRPTLCSPMGVLPNDHYYAYNTNYLQTAYKDPPEETTAQSRPLQVLNTVSNTYQASPSIIPVDREYLMTKWTNRAQ